eukprot:scaffold667360_cov73-Prasinocladus_malaysianus.AAC.1
MEAYNPPSPPSLHRNQTSTPCGCAAWRFPDTRVAFESVDNPVISQTVCAFFSAAALESLNI